MQKRFFSKEPKIVPFRRIVSNFSVFRQNDCTNSKSLLCLQILYLSLCSEGGWFQIQQKVFLIFDISSSPSSSKDFGNFFLSSSHRIIRASSLRVLIIYSIMFCAKLSELIRSVRIQCCYCLSVKPWALWECYERENCQEWISPQHFLSFLSHFLKCGCDAFPFWEATMHQFRN